MGKRILESFVRIDARSLGLFRIAMALVLIGDLFRRWTWLRAFYSNDGVLPNHNHIFNLRDKGQVWSLLHAFSSVGENHFAFGLILLVYLGFLIGYKTRVFHALALLGLVSLGARNILLENQGNYAATALLFFTLFLPLGSRFSIDSLVRSFGEKNETNADELNDRARPSEAVIDAKRSVGWSPMSFAALAVLLQIALILISSALWHRSDPWKTGHALAQALQVERWSSDLGASLRSAPAALLRGLSFLVLATEWLVPALILIPVARRITRGVAMGMLAVYALSLGLFFSLGLYGWTLLAAVALLVPTETWEGIESKAVASRLCTVIYDVDCGVCLWTARLCKRLDLRGHLTFQGNDDLGELIRRKADGSIEQVEMPKSVTEDLIQTSMVVVDAKGNVYTGGRAVAQIFRAFPLGAPIAFVLQLPGISQIVNALYGAFAARRTRVSELCGLNACGVPIESNEDAADEELDEAQVPSALRTVRMGTGLARELAALGLFVAVLAQTTHQNPLPFKLPQGDNLKAAVKWPRMLSKWNVLDVQAEDGVFVVDGQTRKGASVDPLTGAEPATQADRLNARKLGQLWNDYLDRIRLRDNEPFQKAFRDYLAKGGPTLQGVIADDMLVGYDAYWIRYSIATPGQSPMRTIVGQDKLFMHSRGGKLGLGRLPLIKPGVLQNAE